MHIVEWLSKVMTFEGDSAPLAKFVSDNEKAEDTPRPLTPLSANLDQPCSTLMESSSQPDAGELDLRIFVSSS